MSIGIDDVVRKAKYVNFPRVIDGQVFYSPEYDAGSSSWTLLPADVDNMLYLGYERNEHHFTTSYHRRVVLPTLESLFSFGYNPLDFRLVGNFVESGGKVHDLSFQYPIRDKRFHVVSLDHDIEFTYWYKCLMRNRRTRSITWFTEYHWLYCLPHLCSTVENLDGGNGRSILILGDSQIIPSIPVLCYYYSRLTYCDNRSKADISGKLLDSYDDVMIEINGKSHPISYYTDFISANKAEADNRGDE